MKPKVSTGYLTPQMKKRKSVTRKRLSPYQNQPERQDLFDQAVREMLKCPEKKNAIMELLEQNKDVIRKQKLKEAESNQSPLAKVRDQKQKSFESPVALHRRRLLEEMSKSSSEQSDNAETSSNTSEVSHGSIGPGKAAKILQGVVAYVELRNRLEEDRSGGAKTILRSLGAEVRDRFTDDVTHVIFKDGSYATFKRARVRKLHVVSVLWVEACRKSMKRQNEKHFPALGNAYQEESLICSQMEKEYEEIIREEYERSIMNGMPLPTTKSLINRRRTLMTVSVSNSNSSASFETADEQQSNGENVISEKNASNEESSSKLMVDSVENVESSDMELTNICQSNTNIKVNDGEFNKITRSRRQTFGHPTFTSDKSSINATKSTNVDSFAIPDRPKQLDNESAESFNSYIFGPSSPKTTEKTDSNLIDTSKRSLRADEALTRPSKQHSYSADKSKTNTVSMLSPSSKKTESVTEPSSVMSSLRLSFKQSSKQGSSTTNSTKTDLSHLVITSSFFNKPDSLTSKKSISDKENSFDMSSLKLHVEESSSSRKPVRPSTVTLRKTNLKLTDSFTVDSEIRFSKSPTNRKSLTPRNLFTKNASMAQDSHGNANSLTRSAKRARKLYDPDNSSCLSKAPGGKNSFVTLRKKSLNFTDTSTDDSEIHFAKSPTNPKCLTPRNVFPNNPSTVQDSDGNANSVAKKRRRLYNPDNSPCLSEADDDAEREKRRLLRQPKSENINKTLPSETSKVVKPIIAKVLNEKSDGTPVKVSRKRSEKPAELSHPVTPKRQNKINNATPSTRQSLRIRHLSSQPCSNNIVVPPPILGTPKNRRSTMEFMSRSQVMSSRQKLNRKNDKSKWPTIVCTKLHKTDVNIFSQIVKKLGKFRVEDEVSDETTHVVAGESKRTINMLRAISRGCWILRFEWVLKSLERGAWLSEEEFEVTDFAPSVQKCRLERQAFGKHYRMNVFERCPPIYVAPSTNPRSSDLKELITTCKGKVVTSTRLAKIIVGQYLQGEDAVTCVNESWILDSITMYKKLPFKNSYLLTAKRTSVAV